MVGLMQYFAFYNAERPHRSLDYKMPDQAYNTEVGGGALIVDSFGDEGDKQQEKNRMAQRRAVEELGMGTA